MSPLFTISTGAATSFFSEGGCCCSTGDSSWKECLGLAGFGLGASSSLLLSSSVLLALFCFCCKGGMLPDIAALSATARSGCSLIGPLMGGGELGGTCFSR